MRTSFDIVFLLLPNFSMIALYSALEPLRVANRFAGELFSWRFASMDGTAVTASNAIPVSVTESMHAVGRPNLVMVCASYDHQQAITRDLQRVLRKWDGAGVWLGGLDTGSIVLAEAGLLDGRRATCHWETLGAMREDYPRVSVTDALYEIDGPRLTSSGGTAPLDLMLAWIGSLHGRDLATRVADSLVHARHADAPGGTRIPARTRYGVDDVALLAAISAMENHLEDVLQLEDLADAAGGFIAATGTALQTITGHVAHPVLPVLAAGKSGALADVFPPERARRRIGVRVLFNRPVFTGLQSKVRACTVAPSQKACCR